MKIFSILLLVFLSCDTLFAQQKNVDKTTPEVQKMIRKAQKDLQLQAEQLPLVQAVYERTLKNRLAIAPLKATEPEQYIRRLQALQQGEAVSLQRVLDAEQRKLLQQQLNSRRKRAADLAQKMNKQGATPQAIALAQAELQ